MRHVLHERYFTQPLHNCIVVQQDGCFVITNGWNHFVQNQRQVELAAFPIAREVLCSSVN